MKHVSLRLSEELLDTLRALAERDRRSLNSEIIVLLDEAVTARDSPVA